jgi:hypothetical protein
MRITLRNFPLEQFGWGFGAASLALVVAVMLPGERSARHRTVLPGLLVTAAAVGAIGRTWPVTASTVLGLAGVTVAAAWLTRPPSGATAWLAALALMIPAAWLLAADASSTAWVRGFLVAALVIAVPGSGRADVEYGPAGLTPVLYAAAAAGVFAAVPDTEQAATLLGASVPLALLGWPLGASVPLALLGWPLGAGRLGPPGAGAATALLVWVAAVGGRGREPSIIGAVACLGLLVTLPAGQWLAARAGRRRPVRRPRRLNLTLVLVQLVIVAVESRVAGLSVDLAVASAVTAATLLVALAASVLLAARPH